MSSSFFTEGQATNFIEKVFGNGKPSNQGLNISVVCPICKSFKDANYSKQKFVIRTDNFYCQCWICGFKARSLLKILRKYKPQYVQEYIETFIGDTEVLKLTLEEKINLGITEDVNRAPLELPQGFQLLATAQTTTKYVRRHIEYLESRGIGSEPDLWYWKFGFVPWENKEYRYRIIIPSYDSNGELNYWTARSIDKKNLLRYTNPSCQRETIVFNDININWSKELLVVEGPFDLVKTKKANENATCLLGSQLTSDYALFEKIVSNKTPIVLSLDPEARKKQYKIAEMLNEFGNQVKILDLPKHIEDIGSLSADEFTHMYATAIDYNDDYILRMKIDSLQE